VRWREGWKDLHLFHHCFDVMVGVVHHHIDLVDGASHHLQRGSIVYEYRV
jgi:hypothetical protein